MLADLKSMSNFVVFTMDIEMDIIQSISVKDWLAKFCFCYTAFIFKIFKVKMTGVIYISIPFHSRITCEIQ